MIIPLSEMEKVRRGMVICPGSHSWEVAHLGFMPRADHFGAGGMRPCGHRGSSSSDTAVGPESSRDQLTTVKYRVLPRAVVPIHDRRQVELLGVKHTRGRRDSSHG